MGETTTGNVKLDVDVTTGKAVQNVGKLKDKVKETRQEAVKLKDVFKDTLKDGTKDIFGKNGLDVFRAGAAGGIAGAGIAIAVQGATALISETAEAIKEYLQSIKDFNKESNNQFSGNKKGLMASGYGVGIGSVGNTGLSPEQTAKYSQTLFKNFGADLGKVPGGVSSALSFAASIRQSAPGVDDPSSVAGLVATGDMSLADAIKVAQLGGNRLDEVAKRRNSLKNINGGFVRYASLLGQGYSPDEAMMRTAEGGSGPMSGLSSGVNQGEVANQTNNKLLGDRGEKLQGMQDFAGKIYLDAKKRGVSDLKLQAYKKVLDRAGEYSNPAELLYDTWGASNWNPDSLDNFTWAISSDATSKMTLNREMGASITDAAYALRDSINSGNDKRVRSVASDAGGKR